MGRVHCSVSKCRAGPGLPRRSAARVPTGVAPARAAAPGPGIPGLHRRRVLERRRPAGVLAWGEGQAGRQKGPSAPLTVDGRRPVLLARPQGPLAARLPGEFERVHSRQSPSVSGREALVARLCAATCGAVPEAAAGFSVALATDWPQGPTGKVSKPLPWSSSTIHGERAVREADSARFARSGGLLGWRHAETATWCQPSIG